MIALQHVLIAKALSLILVATSTPLPVFEPGSVLLGQCRSDAPTLRSECLGYIQGTLDTMLLYSAARGDEPFCVPRGVTVEQMHDAVVAFIEERPAQWHEGAPGLVFGAIVKAWPCQST